VPPREPTYQGKTLTQLAEDMTAAVHVPGQAREARYAQELMAHPYPSRGGRGDDDLQIVTPDSAR
jgi:hypothetical protein